jgi:WD40 repeat protein
MNFVNGYGWPMTLGLIKVWDGGTGTELAGLAGSGPRLRALAISPDGSTLAVAGDTPLIELWGPRRGTKKGVLTGHTGNATWVGFPPASAILASTRLDGDVRFWDVATRGSQVAFHVDEFGARGLTFAPDGKTLATCHTEGVRFWDALTGAW